MIKAHLINEVSQRADVTKVKAEVAVDAVFDGMRRSMQPGERIELRGFEVFLVRPRKRHIGRSPRTGAGGSDSPGQHHSFQAHPSHRRLDPPGGAAPSGILSNTRAPRGRSAIRMSSRRDRRVLVVGNRQRDDDVTLVSCHPLHASRGGGEGSAGRD